MDGRSRVSTKYRWNRGLRLRSRRQSNCRGKKWRAPDAGTKAPAVTRCRGGGPEWGRIRCRFTPDGKGIISASLPETHWTTLDRLALHDAKTGREQAIVVPPAAFHLIAPHPFQPRLVCADLAGGFHFVEIVGVRYGPPVVVAVASSKGAVARCPKCSRVFRVGQRRLGKKIRCPGRGCDLSLRISDSVPGQ